MKNYGNVESTVKPDAMVIDEHSVWVASNIKEVRRETGEDQVFEGYSYDLVQYDKDEYIQSLSQQLTDTQLALCDVYEMLA